MIDLGTWRCSAAYEQALIEWATDDDVVLERFEQSEAHAVAIDRWLEAMAQAAKGAAR